MVDVFAAVKFLIVEPAPVGRTGRPVIIGNDHHAIANGDRIGSHFLEEEYVADGPTIANEVRRRAKLRETVRADPIEQPANDRTFHLGERVSIRHDRWHITEGFYDTAFSLKAISVATQTSLPKNFHVAKEAVSAA